MHTLDDTHVCIENTVTASLMVDYMYHIVYHEIRLDFHLNVLYALSMMLNLDDISPPVLLPEKIVKQ